jgi:hypothetical protein
MIKAKRAIADNELQVGSQKMFEALAAFKFFFFGYFADFRTQDMEFQKFGSNIDLPNLFADLALKIIFGNDEKGIKLLFIIGSKFETKEGTIISKSNYPIPKFDHREAATNFFNEILRIITEYQDRVPRSIWRQNLKG